MTKRRARASEHICSDHENKLKAYFGRWQGMFEKSIQGGIQNSLEMYALNQIDEYVRDHPMEYMNDSPYPDGEITAYPTAEVRSAGAGDPELGPLADYSFASRRVNLVRQREGILCDALECYFGPIGEHWENLAMGRIGSLYHLTAAGFALLRQEEARPSSPPKASKAAGDAPKGPNRAERRAAAFGTHAPVAGAQSSRAAEVASAALESMMRTGHGRMLTLLSAKDLSEAVREGVARCELEALALLARAGEAWNAADAELDAAVAGRAAR